METWVSKLREKAAHIAAGEYQAGTPDFALAPACMAELSGDLDNLAALMAARAQTQEALTHEVHHRVKNNLQIVTSLLSMQASKVHDGAVAEALGQARARMGALALIHRMLYEQSDLGNQGSVDLARLMTELGGQLRLWHRDRQGVAFVCNASAIALPLDSAMPLSLFAVEAVSNAYAHAFPHGRSGTVSLDFSVRSNCEALLCISDDGIGFDSSGETRTMGRQLMHAFAHQLGGTSTITSNAASGTKVTLAYRIGDQAPQAAT